MDENRILNIFTDKYDHMTDSHLVEGCIGTSDQDEVKLLNACLATIYTINQIIKEEIR